MLPKRWLTRLPLFVQMPGLPRLPPCRHLLQINIFPPNLETLRACGLEFLNRIWKGTCPDFIHFLQCQVLRRVELEKLAAPGRQRTCGLTKKQPANKDQEGSAQVTASSLAGRTPEAGSGGGARAGMGAGQEIHEQGTKTKEENRVCRKDIKSQAGGSQAVVCQRCSRWM